MTPQEITKIFNKFAGMEIPLVEKDQWFHHMDGERVEFLGKWMMPVDGYQNKLLRDIEKLAYCNDLRWEFHFPGQKRAQDVYDWPDCVHIYFEQGSDKKWRISNKFGFK